MTMKNLFLPIELIELILLRLSVRHVIRFKRVYHWVLGSCRGLVLLDYQEKSDELILWNPSTGVYKRYPSPIATDDYLLVLIYLAADAQFFSFKTNSWHTLDDVDVEYVDHESELQTGTLFNGALHWLVFRDIYQEDDDFEEFVSVIIAFDLTRRTLSEIPLLDFFPEEKYEIYSLRECGGYLCLCCSVKGSEMTEIWLMTENMEF
uniref:F-box associated beta-propeller type 1 domain-containing protein n=1 Tax=Glycine max TaxID=3847 RepID=A0A0R0F465_SOYBN